jgi:hypothetical protein
MSNSGYPIGLSGFLNGTLDWDDAGEDYSVAGLGLNGDGDPYVLSEDHLDYGDISDWVIGTAPVTGRSVSGGFAQAANVSPGIVVPLTDPVTAISALVVFRDNLPTTGTSILVAYIDTTGGIPMYRVGDGSAVPITWNAAGIFRLRP